MPQLRQTLARFHTALNDRGVALMLALFIVSLATIVVLGLAQTVHYDQKASRAITERIQDDYLLRSAVNFATIVLSVPKKPGQPEDWLGEYWAQLGEVREPLLEGFENVRVEIVDEQGKININAISSSRTSTSPPGFPGLPTAGSGNPQPGTGSQFSGDTFWKYAVEELFRQSGFQQESFEPNQHRTLGNKGFASREQVAVIHDWIDSDSESHRDASFPAEGIESRADRMWFFNRPLKSLSELLLVPGMTLERVQYVAPFLRVSSGGGTLSAQEDGKININTAPREVLAALSLSTEQIGEIMKLRIEGPINAQSEIMQQIFAEKGHVRPFLGFTSSRFSVIARVKSANLARWARAEVEAKPGALGKQLKIQSFEFY